MFQFDFFAHTGADHQRNLTVHPMPDCEPATELVPIDSCAPTAEETFAAAEETAADSGESFAVELFVPCDEEPAPCDEEAQAPAAEPAPISEPVLTVAPAAQPVEETPWQPPQVGGCTAPTVNTLKTMLGYAENLLISLNGRSSLERKSTRDLSVSYTRSYVTNCYEAALRNHNVVSYMGKLVFPLTGIRVTDDPEKLHLAGLLIPTFSSYNWRFAYTDDVAFTSRFDDACYESDAVEEVPSAAVHFSPAEYLTRCGYKVQSESAAAEPLPAVLVDLVHQIAGMIGDPLVAGFFQNVRTNIPQNKPGHYEMGDTAESSKEMLVNLLQRMGKLGFFTYLSFNKFTNTVNYSLSHSDRCIHFLNGQWLEIYTTNLCRQVVNSLAAEYGLPAQVSSNIVLVDTADTEVPCHELDCAFTIGGLFFWLEAKSSSRNVNYDKYRIRGQLLGVLPDQFLMLNADLTQSEVEVLEWLYPYHAANCSSFADTLRSMVTTALQAERTTDLQAACAA